MSEPVKTRRYDNTRRQAQARATRADVVAAARDLFVQRGYAATTIEAVGEAADTPLATVYRLFGSKRGILGAILDVSFAGDDEPIAMHEGPTVQAAFAEADPRRLLSSFARICRELLDRSAPIQHVLRGAATVDPEAAELLALVRSQRLEGQARLASALAARGALAEGIAEAIAADTIYTLMAPEVHHILTVERAWSTDRYERWLANALCTLLPALATAAVPPSDEAQPPGETTRSRRARRGGSERDVDQAEP